MGLEWVWGLLQPGFVRWAPLLHKTTLTTACEVRSHGTWTWIILTGLRCRVIVDASRCSSNSNEQKNGQRIRADRSKASRRGHSGLTQRTPLSARSDDDDDDNNNNNNNNPRTISIVLSSWPLEVIARVHSVHLMNAAQRTNGCRPPDQATWTGLWVRL